MSVIRGRRRWFTPRAVTGDGALPDNQQTEPKAPVDSIVPVAPALGGQSTPVSHPSVDLGKAPRVLVVDDELSVRRVCTIALRGEGYRAESEGSPLAALDRLRAGEPCDVLVLDYFMPELDGLAFLRELDAAGIARPAVIMASAHADGAVAREALELGVWDFLSKPLTPMELRRSVVRLLQRPSLAAAGDTRATAMLALADRRWGTAGDILTRQSASTETDRLLHGLLYQVCGDEPAAAAQFAQAHWWTGWTKQGPEIWTELARRLDV